MKKINLYLVCVFVFMQNMSLLKAAITESAEVAEKNQLSDEIINDTSVDFWDKILQKIVESNEEGLKNYGNKTTQERMDELKSLNFWNFDNKKFILNTIENNLKSINLNDIKENNITEDQIDEILSLDAGIIEENANGEESQTKLSLNGYLSKKVIKVLDQRAKELAKIEKEKLALKEKAKKANMKRYAFIAILCLIAVFLFMRLVRKFM